MFSVSDRVPDDILQEDFENSSSLLIDQTGDPFDPSSSSESSNGRLGDSLDVVSQDLAVTFGTALSETFAAAFTTSGHLELVGVVGLKGVEMG